MLKSRKPVALILFLWLILLAIPLGRANFCVQAWESGVTLVPENETPDTDYDDGATYRADYSTLPNPVALAQAYPQDPDVQFGLAVTADYRHDFSGYVPTPPGVRATELNVLDALLARNPADVPVQAAWLECAESGLDMERVNDPVHNPYWPGMPPYLQQLPVASPAKAWLSLLEHAVRASRLEPGNAFFDVVRMEALFGLGRDAEALQILSQAARKSTYDDHMREQDLAALAAYGRARALTPFEQERLWFRPNYEFDWHLRDISDCVCAHVIDLRERGQDAKAIATAFDLLRLGELIRHDTNRINGADQANLVEVDAMRFVYLPPLRRWRRFAPLRGPNLPLNVTTNLAGYALAMKEPRIAAAVVAEWKALAGWRSPAVIGAFDVRTGLSWAEAANLQEHWGRLLLRTIPFCLLFLVLAQWASRRFKLSDRFPQDQSWPMVPVWQGAFAGALVLAVLALGDALVGWQATVDQIGHHPWPYSTQAPGLSYLMAPLVSCSVAGTFILLSFARSRRWQLRKTPREPWLPQVRAALRSTDNFLGLDWTPLIRLTAITTIWLVLALLYGCECLNGSLSPGTPDSVSLLFGWILTIFPWFLFLAAALFRWNRLKERRKALVLAVLNLRELCRSYLLFALLLYPVTVLLIVPVDLIYNQIHDEYIRLGQTAEMRLEFGL